MSPLAVFGVLATLAAAVAIAQYFGLIRLLPAPAAPPHPYMMGSQSSGEVPTSVHGSATHYHSSGGASSASQLPHAQSGVPLILWINALVSSAERSSRYMFGLEHHLDGDEFGACWKPLDAFLALVVDRACDAP